MTVDTYLHQGRQFFTSLAGNRRVRGIGRAAGTGAAGFFLSAVGLGHSPQPFSMALVSTMTGWRAVVMGLGSAAGYLIFWGKAGMQGVLWALLAAATALALSRGTLVREAPLILPAFSALWTAAAGLIFQFTERPASVAIYLLRAGLAWGATQFFAAWGKKQAPPPLEEMARVLRQTRLLLLETEDPPIDGDALLVRTRERACGGCPNRRSCRMPRTIPRELLREPLTENTSLPFFCRKPGRMVLEIRRTQEQYRLLAAERDRRREYQAAVRQQYLFLSDYLLDQAARPPRQGRKEHLPFVPEVGVSARSREAENGDRFRHFPGPDGTYFLLLCDGMGTGLGAAEEGKTASALLQGMLTAGFPPAHALESLNSLLALRGRAGAVTADLVQVQLATGSAVVYKWGAVPSLVLRGQTAEKIGTAGPPPGIRGTDGGQIGQRLSLQQGEYLIILSDGVDGEEVRRRAVTGKAGPAGELAARLLDAGAAETTDDATVAVLRLRRSGMLT